MVFFSPKIETLYVCPSRLARAQRLEAQSRLLDAAGAPQVASSANIILFDDLIVSLSVSARGRRLSTNGARTILKSLVVEFPPFYQELCKTTRGQHQVLAALEEARRAGIEATRLHANETHALASFADVLARYEARLCENSWLDRSALLRHAISVAAGKMLPAPLRDLGRIVILPGTELDTGRLDLLAALAALGIAVTAHIPYDASRPGALAWGEQMLWQLEARGLDDISVEMDDRTGEGPLAHARKAFLAPSQKSDLELLPPLSAPLSLRPVPEEQSVYRATAQVLAGWRQDGADPNQMAVVFPPQLADSARKFERLKAELSSVGLCGAALCDGTLDQAPSAQLLFRILAVLAEQSSGEPALDVEDLLQLWRLRATDPLSPRAFCDVARWLRDCGRTHLTLDEMRVSLARTRGRRSPEALQQTSDALSLFTSRLFAAPREASMTTWVDFLHALTLGPDNIFGLTVPHSDEQATLCRCLAEVRHEAADFDRERPLLYAAGDVAQTLRAAFAQCRTESQKTEDVDVVLLLRADEAVGSQFDKVIMLGLERDVWPRPKPHIAPLDETLRHEINARVGPKLSVFAGQSGRAPMASTAKDMWLAVEAMHAAQSEIVFIYQDSGPAAEEGPSEIIGEWLRLGAPVRLPSAVTTVYGDMPKLTAFARAVSDVGDCWAAEGGLRPLSAGHAPSSPARALLHRGQTACALAHLRRVSLKEPMAHQLAQVFFERIHSVSHLDVLGMCRYRFFAESTLGLRTEEPKTLGLGPKERGSLAHAALWVTYRALLQAGGLDWARGAPSAAWDVARRAFDDHATQILRGGLVHTSFASAALADAWQAVTTQLTRDLGDSQAHPLRLEFRFGGQGAQEAPMLVVEEPKGERALRVRGAIDRVDRAGGKIVVVDYKSSRPEGRSVGRRFQLALYASVVMREEPGASRDKCEALWRTLWDGQSYVAEEVSGSRDAFAQTLAENLWARVRPLLGGDISPDADDFRVCARCQVKKLCRVPRQNSGDLL